MKENKLTIANLITSTRLVGSICLLFTEPMTVCFFVIYTLCGISDAIDGWIARATKSTSEFGAKLDSIADLMFYTAMGVQVFPYLLRDLPVALWCVAGAVILTRVVIYLMVAVKHHQFASIHTYLNKATGFVIFVIPYFIACAATVLICSIVGLVSSLATIEELLIHLCAKEYPPKAKTIFQLNKKVDAKASA